MKKLNIYLRKDKNFFVLIIDKEIKKGQLKKEETEKFIEKEKPSHISLILSKPDIVFRKFEFPFSSQSKIKLALPAELEEVLPTGIDGYYYSMEVFKPGKEGKTQVNVYGVKNAIYNGWKELAEKHRVKLSFFSDSIIFYKTLHDKIKEKNYYQLYADKEYVLINLIKEGKLAGTYSFDVKINSSEGFKYIQTFLDNEKLPVFCAGEKELVDNLKNLSPDIGEKNILQGDVYFFPFLVEKKSYSKEILKLFKFGRQKEIPLNLILLLGGFLIVSFIFFAPYLKISEKEKELEMINSEMEDVFREACPEATRVVAPLVQIKEKMMETEKETGGRNYPSVLEVMARLTELFPENVNVEVAEMAFSGVQLTIAGTVDSLKNLDALKEKIEQTDFFTAFKIGSVAFDAQNRVNFNLTMELKK
jgi:hypothetical protein